MRIWSCAMLLAIGCCGCSVLHKAPRQEASYFDLTYPETPVVAGGMAATVASVKAAAPYAEPMVFRVSANQVKIDEFNRWACRPEDMVGKYLTQALARPVTTAGAPRLLAVHVLCLEARLDAPTVMVGLRVVDVTAGQNQPAPVRNYREELPLDRVTGEAFARGAGDALAAIAARIAQDFTAAPATEK